MEKELMEIKEEIKDLFDIILDLSNGLLKMNNKVDDIIMREAGIIKADAMPVEVTHTEPEAVNARGRPRKVAEPQELPRMAEPPKEVRIPASEPNIPLKAPETPQKQSVMERLLGKDASEKARQRAERMAQLEKELAELSEAKK